MTIREVLARNVKAFRRSAGVSQEELADRAGVDRTYVSSIERCRYAVSIDKLDRLAVALGTEAAELLRRDPKG